MDNDEMIVEILADGTLKVVTDEISQPNHTNATELLKLVGRLCGGEVERVKRKDAHLTSTQTQKGKQYQ